MNTFTGPGSFYVQYIRLLPLVVTMYNAQVYWPWWLLCSMYTFSAPGSYSVQSTHLLALVVSMYIVHVYWPW